MYVYIKKKEIKRKERMNLKVLAVVYNIYSLLFLVLILNFYFFERNNEFLSSILVVVIIA